MGETGEIILFGVRVVVDSMRKSVSLNDLSQYEHRLDADSPKEDLAAAGVGGYVSVDEALAHHASGSRGERKRGVPWSEGEHKLFLLGLKRVGKGDWRGISRNYVKTRTPTQVASHAQKYFLRRTNVNRRRRRSSLFDMTTDSVSATLMEEEESHEQDKNNTGSQLHLLQPAQPETSNGSTFSTLSAINRASSSILPVSVEKLGNILPGKVNEAIDLSMSLNHPLAILPAPQASPILDLNLDLNITSTIEPAPGKVNEVTDLSTSLNRPVASLPAPRASTTLDLNLNLNLTSMVEPAPVALDLSLSSDWRRISSKYTAFQLMQGYNIGGSFISVV